MNTFSMTLTIVNGEMVADVKNDHGHLQFEITPTEVKTYLIHAHDTRSLIYTHRSSYQPVIDEMIEVYGWNFKTFYAEYMRAHA